MNGQESFPIARKLPETITPAIEQLKEPLQNLLQQLRAHIDSGSYKLIIGGDASGRIPALILNKVIKGIYKEKGFDIPRTLTAFVSGRIDRKKDRKGHKKTRKIQANIEKNYVGENLREIDRISIVDKIMRKLGLAIPNNYDGRVLVIEDTIVTGRAIAPLVRALRDMGIQFDIATIGLDGALSTLERKLGGKIYFAMDTTPKISGKVTLSGVQKSEEGIFSKSWVTNSTNEARVDAYKIADELITWYLSSSR